MSKGTSEVMLSKVIDESDDESVSELLDKVEDLKAEISTLNSQLAHDHDQHNLLEQAANSGPGNSSQLSDVDDEIDAKQAKLSETRREIQELQSEAEATSIKNADITGATIIRSQLSGLAQVQFDTVIIDEARQIPVPLGLLGMINATKWVVVGDHHQLQPVLKTLSTSDGSPPDDASIFSFLRNRYDSEQWLEYHYRSHADIIGFSQEHVYDGQITIDDSCPHGFEWERKDGLDSKVEAICNGPPVTFVDVAGEQSWRKRFSGSVNEAEVEIVADLVAYFLDEHGVDESDLGVITPYRGQRTLIRDELTDYGDVEVSTVDGFQGREREAIIFSAVNTEPSGLQFAGNENRFNVACTRAKDRFIMVGNKSAIEGSVYWENTMCPFVDYARDHGGVFDWDGETWIDGIELADIDPPVPRDDPEIIEGGGGPSSGSGGTTGPGEGTGNDGGEGPTSTEAVDPKVRSRVEDIVRLAPTSNGELAEAWGLSEGKEAWRYLTAELEEYYDRDGNGKIQPTAKADEIGTEQTTT